MPVSIQQLLVDKPLPETITPEIQASVALQSMYELDYSQLVIVDGDGRLIGMVTTESILGTIINFGVMPEELIVRDAQIPARYFRPDADLFEVLYGLVDQYAVVITDDSHKPIGIVTDFDTAAYFRRRAEDILLLEDIERTLRDYVLLPFEATDTSKRGPELQDAIHHALVVDRCEPMLTKAIEAYLRALGLEQPVEDSALAKARDVFKEQRRTPKDIDGLTFSEITTMLLSKDRWDVYAKAISLPRKAVRSMLDRVRDIRNKVVHFRGEVSNSEHVSLSNCLQWLQNHQSALRDVFRVDQPEIHGGKPGTEAAYGTAEAQERQSTVTSHPEAPRTQRSKYAGLATWLRGVHPNKRYTWIAFCDVEKLINSPLPPLARRHRSWWANDRTRRVQSRLWLEAGFRVEEVDLLSEMVRFGRTEQPRHTLQEAGD